MQSKALLIGPSLFSMLTKLGKSRDLLNIRGLHPPIGSMPFTSLTREHTILTVIRLTILIKRLKFPIIPHIPYPRNMSRFLSLYKILHIPRIILRRIPTWYHIQQANHLSLQSSQTHPHIPTGMNQDRTTTITTLTTHLWHGVNMQI